MILLSLLCWLWSWVVIGGWSHQIDGKRYGGGLGSGGVSRSLNGMYPVSQNRVVTEGDGSLFWSI